MTSQALLIDSKELIYQHNNLIRTSLHMGELEAKIFVHALRGIRQDEEPSDRPLPINIKFSEVVDDPNGKMYKALKAACQSLFHKHLHLSSINSRGKLKDKWVHLVTGLDLDEGTGTIKGFFTPEILPFLQGLSAAAGGKGNFTAANLTKLLTIDSPHAQRMYWILKSWQSRGSVEYSVEQLKFFLFELGAVDEKGVTKEKKDPYPMWGDFNRFVLIPVQKQLDKIGFNVTMRPVKTGKKITGVRFFLPVTETKTTPGVQSSLDFVPPQNNAPVLTDASPKFQQVYNALVKVWGLTPSQIKQVALVLDNNEMKLGKLRDVMSRLNAEKASIDNLAAVLWTNLKKDFPSLAKPTN